MLWCGASASGFVYVTHSILALGEECALLQ